MRATTTYKIDPTKPLVAFEWLPEHTGAASNAAPALRGLNVDRKKLDEATILLLGTGAVNSHVLRGAAQLGVGTILACDMDHFDANSRWTQPVGPGFEGAPKIKIQCAAAHELNPQVHIVGLQGFAQDLPRFVIQKADFVMLSGDNVELVVWTARQAIELGKVVIEAATHGDLSTALLRRYDLRDAAKVCPACTVSEDEMKTLSARIGCSIDVARAQGTIPTQTAPPLCGLAAQLALNEVISEISENPQQLAGEELAYCTANHKAFRTKIPRNQDCKLPHRAHKVVELADDPGDMTLNELLDQGGHGNVSDLNVKAEIPWIETARCREPDCDAVTPVRQFARLGTELGTCICGAPLLAGPLGKKSVVPPDALPLCGPLHLSELGLRRFDSLTVSTVEETAVYFLGSGTLDDWLAVHAERNTTPSNDKQMVTS
jgi:molybdopterin/thiamine biosynthesis adenylyltransferase